MEIALTCPQCAGEVGLDEEAFVFRCQFCGSVLKPTGRSEVQSFFLQPRGTKEQVGRTLAKALAGKAGGRFTLNAAALAYAPYWRVKGLLFQWAFGRKYSTGMYGGTAFDHFKKLRAVSYLRTFPAFRTERFGVFSLGLRAEVLRMRPYHRGAMGRDSLILAQEVPLSEAVDRALKTSAPSSGAENEKVDISKTGLIGESYSLLYFPFYCYTARAGGKEALLVVDALSHKVVKGDGSLQELKETPDQAVPYKPLDFIPFKCPNCGWDLPYRPRTRIHLCRTCGRAWEESGGAFHEVPFKASSGGEENGGGRYLPFWVLTLSIETPSREYRTLKDFYELFPIPKVLDQEAMSQRPIRFFIPAFPIRNAAAVDKFAAQLTRTQPVFEELEPSEFRPITDSADVRLPAGEALEMAEILLYSMAPQRARKTQEVIKGARLKLRDKHLLWMPFFEKGIFLREALTDFAIQKNCIEVD